MYSFFKELQPPIKEELERLGKRDRFVKPFLVEGAREYKSGCFQISIIFADGKFCGGFRRTIESQLVQARVCKPKLTAQEELNWRQLRQILYQFLNRNEVDNIIWEHCRNATLHGWIDGLERKLPLATYLRAKALIKGMGNDYWDKDFEWYFSKSPDQAHKGQGDFWRGLE